MTGAAGDLAEVGRLGRAHGLKGELFLRPLSDIPERFVIGSRLELAGGHELVIDRIRPHDHGYLVGFAGLSSRNDAEDLAGSPLYGRPLELPGVTLVSDLIGSQLVDQHGIDHGVVVAVEENPASELMVLGSGQLVPTIFITRFEPGAASRVEVEVPDGLFDL